MRSSRAHGSVLSLSLLLLAILAPACQDDDPQLIAPLAPLTIRAVTADGWPYETTFEISSFALGSRSFIRAETMAGVAQVSVAPGAYRIRDTRTGAYLSGSVPVLDGDLAQPVSVTRNDATDVAFRYASLHVKLEDSQSRPVAWGESSDDFVFDPSRFRSEEHFLGDSTLALSVVVPDLYRFGVREHADRYPTTFYPDAPSLRDAEPLSIVAGEFRRVTISLPDGGWLRLIAPTPSRARELGLTPQHSIVLLNPAWSSDFGRADTLVAGPVRAGHHRADVTLQWRSSIASTTRRFEFDTLIAARETTEVTIESRQGLEVSIDGNAGVSLEDIADRSNRAYASGPPLLLFVDPGSFRLEGDGNGSVRTFWPQALLAEEAQPIEITAGSWTKLDWALIPAGTIRGRILTEDGSFDPLARMATVTTWFARGDSVNATLDASGRFVLYGLEPGLYKLRTNPRAESAFAPTWYGDTTSELQAQTIQIEAGDWIDAIEIRQRPR